MMKKQRKAMRYVLINTDLRLCLFQQGDAYVTRSHPGSIIC